jgi:SNF2 family DNA or RNA helicase
MESVDTTPAEHTVVAYETVEEEISADEILQKALRGIRLEESIKSGSKRELMRIFKEGLGEDDDIVSVSPRTLPAAKTEKSLEEKITLAARAEHNEIQRMLGNPNNVCSDVDREAYYAKEVVPDTSLQKEEEEKTETLNSMVDTIFADMQDLLHAHIKMHAKRLKLAKRRRVELKKIEYSKKLTFIFPSGLEIHMEGPLAAFFEILLPTVILLKERIALVKLFRNSGVKEEDRDYEVKGDMEPFDHQWVMYKIQDLLPHCANLSKMGTGKSFPVTMNIDKRMERGEVRKGMALIICPNTLTETWVQRHIHKGAPHLKAAIICGSYSERMNMILSRETSGIDIYITNFETFSMKSKFEHKGKEMVLPLAPLFKAVEWDMVVIDEAHKIKNPAAQRTKNIIDTFSNVPYSIIMSGTINANKLYDIHAPFVFLNHAKQFSSLHFEHGSVKPLELGTMHSQFVDKYFDGSGYKKEPKNFAMEELRERMEEISVLYEKSDCFDLPPKLYEQRMIDMDPKQAQLYVALKNFLTAQLAETAENGGTVTIIGVLAMMVKLAEAANGWIYDDQHQLINLPTNPKRDAVMDILADLGDNDKVTIWSRFTNDLHLVYEAIKNEYGEEAVAIVHGDDHCPVCGTKKADRFKIQEKFNDPADPLRFVVVNTSIGSHGWDLFGTYAIFFSNSFVKTDRSQAEDRHHRYGMREEGVTIIDLVMRDTVDEDVLMALKSWKSVTAALLGHLGVNTEKLFSANSAANSGEAPVVIEHIAQRPGECALTAIAMLCGKSIELVRSWMTVHLGSEKLYKGQNTYILDAVRNFIPEMEGQWKEYTEEQEKARVSLELKELPKSGSGLAVIRYEKSKRIAHAIAFNDGLVYDPARSGKVGLAEYETWMASSHYVVEWVFKMKEGEKISVEGYEGVDDSLKGL